MDGDWDGIGWGKEGKGKDGKGGVFNLSFTFSKNLGGAG